MSSTSPTTRYHEYRDTLLDLALRSIRHGLERRAPLPVEPRHYPEALRNVAASFVTLKERGQLRGCMGTLEAHQSLAQDVARNAFAAAFSDPRFLPVAAPELSELRVNISILHPAEPVAFNSEEDLVDQLRPGVDGLILEANGRKGTFLPAVWESFPRPEEFLANLKLKAGLPPQYWSDDVKVWRYTTEAIE